MKKNYKAVQVYVEVVEKKTAPYREVLQSSNLV